MRFVLQLKTASFLLTLFLIVGFVGIPEASGSEVIPVGVFYYTWYEEGLGKGHWNDTIAYGGVLDTPTPHGFYSSQNLTVLKWQIEKMREAKIDYAFTSWWGPRSYTDNSTKKFIEALDSLAYPIDFAILVEPYEGVNFTQVYNYVFDNYVSPYSFAYFNFNGKPLLGFWAQENPEYDERFTVYRVDLPGSGREFDWRLWSYPDPVIAERGKVVTVTPRYDDKLLYDAGGRPNFHQHDMDYSERLYEKQWKFVLDNKDQIDMVLIYSWNEYHERSQIEPHIDKTAKAFPPYWIYDKTTEYVSMLKQEPPDYTLLILLIIVVVMIVLAILALLRKRIKDWIWIWRGRRLLPKDTPHHAALYKYR